MVWGQVVITCEEIPGIKLILIFRTEHWLRVNSCVIRFISHLNLILRISQIDRRISPTDPTTMTYHDDVLTHGRPGGILHRLLGCSTMSHRVVFLAPCSKPSGPQTLSLNASTHLA